MNQSDIAALMRGIAPVLAEIVRAEVEPMAARIAELEDQLARAADPSEAIAQAVAEAVEQLPPPQAGKDADADEIQRMVSAAVSALPPAPAGAPGKLPVARAWDGEVTYEAEARTHKGALWQAVRDTGREPGHEDWICIAAAGAPGKDADEIMLCGTYQDGSDYSRLSIVALNGGAFMAKSDDPGPCPGDGWQVIAMRGKSGQPGKSIKGDPGKAIKGDPGAPVVAMSVDESGMLRLVNGDGSTVDCDLYPLLSKIGTR